MYPNTRPAAFWVRFRGILAPRSGWWSGSLATHDAVNSLRHLSGSRWLSRGHTAEVTTRSPAVLPRLRTGACGTAGGTESAAAIVAVS